MNKDTFPTNQALKPFELIIGTWKTEGSHGMIPDTALHGQTSFGWHDSSGYIVLNSSIEEDVGIPTGMAIIASDDELGTFFLSYYDDRGISRRYEVSMEGNIMKWWREAPSFSQRYSLTISEDGETMVGKGELSKDGKTWEKDLDLTYHKVSGSDQ